MLFPVVFLILDAILVSCHVLTDIRPRRSINVTALQPLISDTRLPKDVTPTGYIINLRPNIDKGNFTGNIKMNLTWNDESNQITLHAHYDLQIEESDIKLKKFKDLENNNAESLQYLKIQKADRLPGKTFYVIHLKEALPQGSKCELEVAFNGQIGESIEGMFKQSYMGENGNKQFYLATYMRPNNARRLFPCFDEPGIKVPFTVSISRPKNYVTLFNTPVLRTQELNNESDYVIDHFETTLPMSTFTFGFVQSQLKEVNADIINPFVKPNIKLWARPDIHHDIKKAYKKIYTIYQYHEHYLGVKLPLSKMDFVAIPGLKTRYPADNWGLIVFDESYFFIKGYYVIAQEIIYQWLGSCVTPYWWSDAHVNQALSTFLTSNAVIEIDNRLEYNGEYRMAFLYNLYYELSKRYPSPYWRGEAVKQELKSFKTILVMRMFNYTLGKETFMRGVRKLIDDRQCSTFFGDDLWDALTQQAHEDHTLPTDVTIKDIAESWITKDRLPIVSVIRDYSRKTASISQEVYLRDHPHDLPENDKMLWWIPLVLIRQDKLDFSKYMPYKWMTETRDLEIGGLPDENNFIIINPEEIGPFPVNYDEKNWNLLAQFLQTNEKRTQLPIETRAKLLNDAWNLAFAGDLNFATAFNMTLFVRNECEPIIWQRLFTFINHIGDHIDRTSAHKKFETYVRILLISLYEKLGQREEHEEKWKTNLGYSAWDMFCEKGYRPCFEEAQSVYRKWMNSPNPDEANLYLSASNKYICNVFKWGTDAEWEFGLQRVISFSLPEKNRYRSYLLKTLTGCPIKSDRIEKILRMTILERNGNFTENEIYRVINLRVGGTAGYTTRLKFLTDNWDKLQKISVDNSKLWDSIISSATSYFATHEGYYLVAKLYKQRKNEFGSAKHIIEESLKTIKEITKWNDENLPVIENWLDNFLASTISPNDKFMG